LFGSSDICEQLLVALKFILPVAVTSGESTRRTAAPNVNPSHVLNAIVESNADGDLEISETAWTLTLFEGCVRKIIGAVSNGMARLARATLANRRTFRIVDQEFKSAMPASAESVCEVCGGVSVPIRVVSDLCANVGLRITVTKLAFFLECHAVIFLPNVKCGGTAEQDSQSEANEGRYTPLPPTTCSPLFGYRGISASFWFHNV
jgi:hypothetical protein